MNRILIIICILLIAIIIINEVNKKQQYKYMDDQLSVVSQPAFQLKAAEDIKHSGFVNPEHKLIQVLQGMSSGSKIKLTGSCKSLLYTKHTLTETLQNDLLALVKYVLTSLHKLSSQNYYIKEIENAYIQVDKNKNRRFILDFFMYDVQNYYSVRVVCDIVIIDNIVYMNYINILPTSTTNIIDRYNYKFNSQGILIDSDMFQENMDELLNQSYKQHYTIIGVNDTNNDYSDLDLSSVMTLESIANMYLPTYIKESEYTYYKEKELDGYLEKYYPPDLKTIQSPQFCQKYKNQEWDNYGNPTEQKVKDYCVTDHNQTSIEYNQPWYGPGVMYERSSQDRYSWLKDPERGNIIRAQGY